MNRPHVLMPAPMHPRVVEALATEVTLHRLWEAADPEALLARIGPEVRGIASSTLAGTVGRELLSQLPAVEIVANFGVGYENIDVAAATQRGVVVTNTPGVLDEDVADLAVGLLLATLRQIPQADRFVRKGRWPQGSFPLSPTLRGRRVGIVGLGAIGKAVARRLAAFGVAIAYHGRSAQISVPHPYFADVVSLAAASDVLVVIVPGGAATRYLIDRAVLRALGPQGVLVNVARGSVVDEAALVAALEAGEIMAAGLDVYEDEPHVPQALLDLPGVVLLPHVGSATEHTRRAMAQLVADNLLAWFAKGAALTPVPESRAMLAAR